MPRYVCCVPGCSILATDGVPLHYFPNPETFAERFQVWVKNIGGDIVNLDSATVLKTRRICRRHFETQFLYPKNRLSKLAVPTLLLPSGDIPGIPCKRQLSDVTNVPNCNPTFAEPSTSTVLAPGTSRATDSTIDIIQTPNSSGETKTIAEARPTLKSPLLLKPIEDLPVQDTPETTQELPSCSTTETKSFAEARPTLKSPLLLKPIEDLPVQDTPETTQELPSCSTTVENTDICDDDDDADDDSNTLLESNVCRVCLALDVKMYDFKDIALREMFQNITGIAVAENNHSVLKRLCWECAGRLKAAAAFRNQALLSDALLQGLASTGEQIRINDITLIKENENYLKSAGSLSAVEVFHIVDINPENDSVPHISEKNDTEIVQKTVRNDSIKLIKGSIIKEDNDQMDVEEESVIEAPTTTEMKYDQFDHISPNTGEESSNIFLETITDGSTNNVPFTEDKINSANSSPLPSCSHVEPKYPILSCRRKTPSDFEDKIKKSVIKKDSISKVVSKHSKEVTSMLKGDAKLKNIYVKIGAISKNTSNLKLVKMTSNLKLVKMTPVKANTPTHEESLRLEDFKC